MNKIIFSSLFLFYTIVQATAHGTENSFQLLKEEFKLQVRPIKGQISAEIRWQLKFNGTSEASYLLVYLSDVADISKVTSGGKDLKWKRTSSLIPFFSTTAVSLPHPVNPGERITITIFYSISRHMKNTGLAAMSMSLKPGAFYLFEGWTPTLEPFLDENGFVGKVQKAPFKSSITIPDPYTTITTGSLINKTSSGSGRTFTYECKKNLPFFIPLIAGKFSNHLFSDLKIPVEIFKEGEINTADSESFCNFISNAAEYQANLLGRPLPPKIRIIFLSTGGLARGFYNMILLPPYCLNFWHSSTMKETICHELSHTYFGNLVTAYGPGGNEFLSEGFATFMGVTTVGHLDGKDVENKLFQDMRSDFFSSKIQNIEITKIRPMQNVLSGEVYNKGALILNELLRYTGKDKFQAILKKYINKYNNSFSSLLDFQHICEAVYGQKMDLFFDQYLRSTRLPLIRLQEFKSSRIDSGNWKNTITLKNNGLGFGLIPVELLGKENNFLSSKEQREGKNLFVPAKSEKNFSIITSFKVEECRLDPDHTFLQGVKRASILNLAKDKRKKGRFKESETEYKRLLLLLPEDGEAWYGLGRNYEAAGSYKEACRSYDRAAQYKGTLWLPSWAWLRKADCLSLLGKKKKAIELLQRVLENKIDIYNIQKEAKEKLKQIKESK